MPTPAKELVDQARDFHASFDPRSIPERAALRELSRLQRRLAQQVTAVSEDALAEPFEVSAEAVAAAAAGGVSGGGIILPDHALLLGIVTKGLNDESEIPVDLVSYANVSEGQKRWPAAFILRQRLFPISRNLSGSFVMKGDPGSFQHGWEGYGLYVVLVPTPPELTTPASLITLPDSAHDALVTGLGLWMARRKDANLARTLGPEHDEAMQAAVTSLAGQDTTSTWTVVRK